MDRSDTINELLAAMSQAYGDLKNAKLNAKNPHFKSEYATLEEILNVIRPTASKYGLMFSQIPETIDGEVHLTTFVGHKSGQWMKSSLKLILQKPTSQEMGSAITYARRYSISSWFGIGEGDDDDGNTASEKETKASEPKPIEEPLITPDQVKLIQAKADLLPPGREKEILEAKKWKSWANMKQKQFKDCIAFLEGEAKREFDKEINKTSDKAPWEA